MGVLFLFLYRKEVSTVFDDYQWSQLTSYRRHYMKGIKIMLKERHKRSYGQVSVILSNLADVTECMMSKLKKETKKEYVKPKFVGYVNAEIPHELKPDCKAWIREDEVVALELDEMAASLYRLSFGIMQGQNSYQASATCNDPDSPNAGLVLSAQASSWYDALAVLCWKHRVLLKTKWTENIPLDADSDIG